MSRRRNYIVVSGIVFKPIRQYKSRGWPKECVIADEDPTWLATLFHALENMLVVDIARAMGYECPWGRRKCYFLERRFIDKVRFYRLIAYLSLAGLWDLDLDESEENGGGYDGEAEA